MRDSNKLRRSNLILIGLVIILLIFGAITRIQSGDTNLYLFGYTIQLPFSSQEQASGDTAGEVSEETGNTGTEAPAK